MFHHALSIRQSWHEHDGREHDRFARSLWTYVLKAMSRSSSVHIITIEPWTLGAAIFRPEDHVPESKYISSCSLQASRHFIQLCFFFWGFLKFGACLLPKTDCIEGWLHLQVSPTPRARCGAETGALGSEGKKAGAWCWGIMEPYGNFMKFPRIRVTPKWLVCKGKSHLEMDDDWRYS